MKKKCRIFCFFLLLFPAAFAVAAGAVEPQRTGQNTCYDLDGTIIDHDGTGQDGDLQAGLVWPDPRFADNGDGTITDNLTGLIWLKDGKCLEPMTWQAASEMSRQQTVPGKFQCVGITEPGSCWSLPEVQELETLVNAEEIHGDRWLNVHGFREIQPGPYWSATFGPDSYNAWSVNLTSGEVVKSPMVDYHHVLLVHRPAVSVSPRAEESTEPEARPHSESGSRFVDNGDGTVTDNRTGLMWLKAADCLANNDWSQSLEQVKRLNQQGIECRELSAVFSDWALPNRHELRSLIDHQTDLPALAENPFVGLQPLYWTSTTVSVQPDMAFVIHFGTGELRMTSKKMSNFAWAVRPAAGRRVRARIPDKTEIPVVKLEHFQLRPIGEAREISWPPRRFTDLDDGTVIDNLTGLMWLKDVECFNKRQWYYADFYLKQLNSQSAKITCREYSAAYDDWQLPDIETMMQVVSAANGEPAAWLTRQGVVDARPRDYWTVTANEYNLYYAWAVNLRQGTPRNYPKDFRLYLWPVRHQQAIDPVKPELALLGNGARERVVLGQGEELDISVTVDNVSAPVMADYYLCYESPDGSFWWLSADGNWLGQETALYQGNIFEVAGESVFLADTTGLVSGNYNFHFKIKPCLDQGNEDRLFVSDLLVCLGASLPPDGIVE